VALHTTVVFDVPVTVAVKGTLDPGWRLAVEGETATVTDGAEAVPLYTRTFDGALCASARRSDPANTAIVAKAQMATRRFGADTLYLFVQFIIVDLQGSFK
jgi:hypothetical protein